MNSLIPTLCITALAAMVFGLCYMLAVRDDRIMNLEEHDLALRGMLADTRAERDEGWRFFHNADERVSALLAENSRFLCELAYIKRGMEVQDMNAEELIESVERMLEETA